MKHRTLVRLLIAGGAFCGAPLLRADAIYDITKTFTWDVSRKVNANFVEVTGAKTGTDFYFDHAFAQDKHDKVDMDDPGKAPFGAAFPFDLAYNVNKPDIRNGRVEYDQHGKYSVPNNFDQGAAFPQAEFGLAFATAGENNSLQHPSSLAATHFDVKRLGADASGRFHDEASINLNGSAKQTKIQPRPTRSLSSGLANHATVVSRGGVNSTLLCRRTWRASRTFMARSSVMPK